MFGSISTANYHYYSSHENKLSYIVRNFGPDDRKRAAYLMALKDRYSLPKSEVDTNAAYAVAMQLMTAFEVDVQALQRDSEIEVVPWWVSGDEFGPLYTVSWRQPYASLVRTAQPMDDGYGSVASIQFLKPEKLVIQLDVQKGSYMKRKPLRVPDREHLLQETDDRI